MDKIDTSTAEEAVKDAARQFMSDLLPTAAPTVDEVALNNPSDGTTTSAIPTTTTTSGTDIIKTWKAAYGAATATSSSGRLFHKEDAAQRLMTTFWSLYDPAVASIWTMEYDHAESTESFSEAREIVTTLLTQNTMVTTMEHDCFGIGPHLGGSRNPRLVVLQWTRSGTIIWCQRRNQLVYLEPIRTRPEHVYQGNRDEQDHTTRRMPNSRDTNILVGGVKKITEQRKKLCIIEFNNAGRIERTVMNDDTMLTVVTLLWYFPGTTRNTKSNRK